MDINGKELSFRWNKVTATLETDEVYCICLKYF